MIDDSTAGTPVQGDEIEARPGTSRAIPIRKDPIRGSARIPRNAPCPCGSGRKVKRCCLSPDPVRTAPRPAPGAIVSPEAPAVG